ncbi:MAG: sulfurtransferase TusD [Euryarchaeota archaeon]|nr:sulfurtransferase TusD [Euryarchaeota archaeon]
MKIGILLLTGPYQHEASDTAYHFAKAALARGHEVLGIFLYTDGVNNANRAIAAPGFRNIGQMFSELGAKTRVVACGTCARFRGLGKDLLAPKTAMGGMGALVKMLQDCDRFLVFGGG